MGKPGSVRRRGMTFIEVLIAFLVVAISISAMVRLWNFSYSLAVQNDAKGAAYNIARRIVERAKQANGGSTPVAAFMGMKNNMGSSSSTNTCLYYPTNDTYVSALYYDEKGSGENSTQQATSKFSVTATAVADKMTTDATPAVAADALITITITVTQLSGLRPVTYVTATNLVRSGI